MDFPLFDGTGLDPVSLAERRHYGAGEQIELPAGLGLVERGSVRVTRGSLPLNVIGGGGVFGASTLCSGRRADTVLTAEESTDICYLSEETVLRLLTENRTFLTRYLAFVSRRICFLNDKVGTFASASAEDKLLCHLIQCGGAVTVSSMKELAASLSMGRASLYRAVDSLVSGGKISRDGDRLTLI